KTRNQHSPLRLTLNQRHTHTHTHKQTHTHTHTHTHTLCVGATKALQRRQTQKGSDDRSVENKAKPGSRALVTEPSCVCVCVCAWECVCLGCSGGGWGGGRL